MIIEAIKNFISEFDEIDQMIAFYTDNTSNEASYSIDPLPGSESTKYVDGGEKIGFLFAFSMVGASADESSRIANQNFFESFSNWLNEQTRSNNLPELTDKCTALKIEALTPLGYSFETDDANSVAAYQIQCKLTYNKEV